MMTATRNAGALALAMLLAACGEEPATAPQSRDAGSVGTAPATEAQVYSGTGTVQSISGDNVTIAHGPIKGIGWPAMTMTFTASPAMTEGVAAGSKVDFSFRQDGGSYALTLLQPR